MEVTITGSAPRDLRQRVLAIESFVKAVCQEANADPADGVMALLAAAAHLTMQHAKRPTPARDRAALLAESLGYAIIAAEEFFTLREVANV